ncbi:MAG: TIM barrel protein [Sphingomonadaceae bacterium]|nr:TIM barrel protein [Sphingomonadaceae bacterium]
MMRRLALDHITTVDCGPIELAQIARETGCEGICLFMESMDVLPLMPPFDIYSDLTQRREFGRVLRDLEMSLDLAYPFTLAGRTEIADFAVAMECAAELGAGLVNVLVYDRDPARRADKFAAFCDMARGFGLKVGVEFYPVSQIRSLAEALELVQAVGRPGEVGINADLLHLMRSGGSIAALAAAPVGTILYGQLCDGPATRAAQELDFEASSDRLLPGDGCFDLAGFVAALPAGCPLSVEVPRNAAITPDYSPAQRAKDAINAVRRALAGDR